MAKQLFTILTVFFWVLFFYAFHKDRSRYRNCVLLFIALCSTIECALLWAGDDAFRIAFPVIGFILLLVPFFLIWNGIITIHKEGFRLSHMLSLALGLIIAFGEASLLFVVMDLSGQVASEWFPAIPVSTFALLTG
ncbi:MAG: hypothetical protein J6D18_04190, partial [Erysipelotrichaceae bacterium]|nr:hypothetical protein [Erysipelotrichaceae bacterium]